MEPKKLLTFLNRMEVLDPHQAETMDRDLIVELTEKLRAEGTLFGCDFFIQGIGAVCMPIKSPLSNEIINVGIVGPSSRIHADQAKHKDALSDIARKLNIQTLFKVK